MENIQENQIKTQLLPTYNPKIVEDHWYQFWIEHDLFKARDQKSETKPYSIVMPPPNITGSLHIGHALNNTLQDIMIRWKRMQGYDVLWVPGTDHAGIATQNVVEREIAKEGMTRYDLGREKFLERAWQWREKYGSNILNQLKKMGCSCDWSRLRFTLDEGLSKAVRKVFVSLYQEGLIYRSNYVINWCPRCQTALADIEVEQREENALLYYIIYPLKDSIKEYIVVATTRPETMLGDTAIAVNPNDKRYKDYIGKIAILPLVGRELTIVADDYVDPNFGTGAVKITPAHDLNDFELGRRHHLEEINILNDDGTTNQNAGSYANLSVQECREKVLRDLKEKGYMKKIEEYRHSLGHCYRCDTVIEPYLSQQWFVKMANLAKPAIEAVEKGNTNFIPKRWTKVYYEWMYNIKDWCISRQLWWGHRIPVWYCQDCGEIIVQVDDPTECPKCHSKNIVQDKDVLDTWFSSALWPFSTLGWPDQNSDLEKYYPTSLLITGFDIIFFWVARMMMMGIKFQEDIPFRAVFINPLIKDIEGKKMSKSRGNVIDPLLMIDQYGADALRMTLASLTIQANYIRLSKEKIETFRNFTNKIWNVSRFCLTHLEGFDPKDCKIEDFDFNLFDQWILDQLNITVKKVTEYLNQYKFSDAAMTIYEFTWNYFCDWYIELVKDSLYRKDIDKLEKRKTQYVLWHILDNILRLLHPFMPFISEEIWQKIPHKELSISISPWPEYKKEKLKKDIEEKVSIIQGMIKTIRNIKAEMNIPLTKEIDTHIRVIKSAKKELIQEYWPYIKKLAHVHSSIIESSLEKPAYSATGVLEDIEIFVPLKGVIDLESEVQRLENKLTKVEKEMTLINKKLKNIDFIQKAPEDIIQKERIKIKELTDVWNLIDKNLKALKSL
ncbi:MAG: valine--tRNA ligase [Candidatus Atribacteria bacterium]|nr:valine--tRNA ligase [Candidatus Atribacteria bacterium]